MLKVAQKNTISFNKPTKNINYQLLIETHSRKRENTEQRSRYRRSDSDQKESNAELFIAIRKKKQSEEKKLEKIEQIFEKNPKPNVKAQDGNDNMDTPLHMAVRRGYLKIVNFLLQNGGDNDLPNKDDNTPLMLARQLGNSDIITTLERAMPRASQSDNTINRQSLILRAQPVKNLQSAQQVGWNCFDVAIDLANILGITSGTSERRATQARAELVKRALAHSDDLEYRNLLAPEIRHAAALTVAAMNSSNPASTDSYLLPLKMRNDELKNLYNNYSNTVNDEQVIAAVATCNDRLGNLDGQRKPFGELKEYFENPDNRQNHQSAYQAFNQAQQIVGLAEEAFSEYCSRESTYRQYIQEYYGNNQWFAFQGQTFEHSTSMVDVTAKLLSIKISIYDLSQQQKMTHQTAAYGHEISVNYNGVNHFTAKSGNSGLSEDERSGLKRRLGSEEDSSSSNKKIKTDNDSSNEEMAIGSSSLKRNLDVSGNEGHVSKTKIISNLPKETDVFPASGVKSTLHGIAYQWKILMLMAKRCQQKGYDFRLATEMNAAEKFDDAVLWYSKPGNDVQHSIFLQAKHIEVENEAQRKITTHDLLTEKDDRFSLQKYFLSYQKIRDKKLGENGKFFIYTNIGFDFDNNLELPDLKKLSSLYLKAITGEDDLLKFKDDKNFNGQYYRLMSSPDSQEQTVVAELKELFERTSEFKKLATSLAQHLISGESIKLEGLFKEYHQALARYVIDVKSKKLKENFVNDLSPELSVFRKTLRQSIEDGLEELDKKPQEKRTERDNELIKKLGSEIPSKKPKITHQAVDTFWGKMVEFQFVISDGFQKIFIPAPNPKLNNPMGLAKEIARLITNKEKNKNNTDKKITISQGDKTGNKIINPELPKLAGYVLVKGKGDKEIIFSNSFLEGNSDLKKALLGEFKLKNNQELKDRLMSYTFSIANFETCQESELENIIKSKPHLPKQQVTDAEVNDFLKHLVFAVNQPNEIRSSELINEELGAEFNLIDAGLITNDFQNKILGWLKEKQGSYFSENQIDSFFKEMGEKISQLVLVGPTAEYTQKLQGYGIAFDDKDFYDKLKDFLNPSSTGKSILNIIVEPKLTLFGSIKINQEIANKRRGSYIFIRLSSLTRLKDEVLRAFRKNENNLLVIECKSKPTENVQELYNELSKVLFEKKTKEKKVIFISTRDNQLVSKFKGRKEYQEIFEEIKFSNLNIASRQKILEKTVNFQGREVTLKQLMTLESPLTELLPLAGLIEEKPLEIGKPLPIYNGYDKAYYIDRTFHPYIEIKQSILNDKKFDDLFSIGINQGALGREKESHNSLVYSEQAFKQQREKYPTRNIHWLKREPGQPLVWRQSHGDSTLLHKYINTHSQIDTHHFRFYPPKDLDKFLQQARHQKVMLIADTAGMGKSTVLTSLSKQVKETSPTHWVARIDLNDHIEALKAQTDEKIEAVKFLSEKLLTLDSPLEKGLFEQRFKEGKVVLMLDGFDEISPAYKEIVIDLLQSLKKTSVEQLWVTTRPHLRKALEDKLQQLSYTLAPFSEDNQVEFLTKFWRQKLTLQEIPQNRLEIYSKVLLKKLKESINDEEKELTGIPLQIRMLAESFKDELKIFCNSDEIEADLPEKIDLLDLYEKFIDKKFDIYQEEKNKIPLNNVGAQEQRARDNKNIRKKHQKLALQVLLIKEQVDILQKNIHPEFPTESVARIGIISYIDKKPHFIHKTFAEYFLSSFLVENLSNPTVQNFLLKEILIQDNYQISRNFLNSYFKKKPPGEVLLKEYGKHVSAIWSNKISIDETFFTIAAKENNAEILRFLLESLKNYPRTLESIIADNEVSLLHIAASHGHREFVEVFLSFYQDKEKSWTGTIKMLILRNNNEGTSLLKNAAINYKLKFVEWFLNYIKNKVEPNSPGVLNKIIVFAKDEYILLHLAIQEDHLEVAKVLTKQGANIEATNKYGETPLHRAAFLGNLELVKFLIENRANINAADENNTTPLHLAAEENYLEVVKFLIENRANIEVTNDNKATALHLATEEGHLEVVKFLIKNRANIDATDEDKRTPLHWAAEDGHIEMVKVLIENRASIDATDKYNWTALHLAAEKGHLEVVKFLIENRANIDATAVNKATPLHLAAEEGHLEVVKFLIKNRANINVTDDDKMTPLHMAAEEGHLKVVKFLIENRANIDATDEDKTTPLHMAAFNGHLEVVKVFIENRANIEATDENKVTPLHQAAQEGRLEVVKVFIEKGANIEATDKNNWTPLHLAAEEGHLEVVKFLIENKANIEAIDKNKATSLHMAAEEGHLNVVEFLIKNKANIEATDEDKTTPLHLAAEEGRLKVVKFLIKNRANIEAIDEDKTTSLHLSAQEGHLKVVKFLIENKANIEATDENKVTSLHRAARYGRFKVVKFLIENKANIEATDENKATSLHMATQEGHLEVIKFLIENKANIEATDKNNRTPLHIAAEEGHLKVVKFLIENKANIEATDKNNRTPLHWVTEEDHFELVKVLIEKGANIEAADKNNQTPLHLASEEGHLEVVKVLIEKGANIEATDKNNWTPLHLAAQREHWAIIVTLLNRDAKISDKQCDLLKQYAEHSDYENKPQLLQLIEQRSLTSSIERLGEIRAQSESLGLEVLEDASAACQPRRRRRHALGHCAEDDEQEQQLFPYEPLEESALVVLRQAARLYSQLALAAAWQQGEVSDTLVRYQRYLGDILEEGESNQSPREQQLIREHYQQAISFFQNNPKTTLLETQADDFAPLADHSVILENGQHSLLLLNEGPRYQLYSPDFNYRQRFHTRPGVSWAELSAFIQAFFQWKSGRRDYQVLTLQDLPVETLKSLREAPFWKPEALVPDSVLLAREHSRGIEEIPAEVVRELVRVNGQVVEASALHADFFQQTAGIQLRVENLHVVLGELTSAQRRALVRVVRKYQWAADSTLLESLDAEARPLFADYQQQVMTELKTAETLTPERLAEFSWQAMQQAFNRAEIPSELTQQALTHLKELQATSAKRAWAKGMVTQTLFFLPDMIRAANTGQVDGLVRMGGMLAADSTVNHLYGNLLERLTPTLSEARLGLLRKLPVTSPVFKALTVYSIVELTQQLQSLPADSEQRNTIKHRLGEQYVTAGLMVAELFGWELGPLWVALIAEQLIFEAINFRKENQLDIPFWEAFIMSLGFEQDKLQHVLEERQLVELNLATINNINTQAQPPYSLVLVRVPTLGPLMWNDIDESQVPPEIKQQVLNQPEPLLSFISNTVIREAGGFRQIREHCGNFKAVNSGEAPIHGRLVKSYWKRGDYTAQAAAINVHWTPGGHSCQEDNIFLKQLTIFQGVNNTFERLVSVAGSGYQTVVLQSPIQITGEGLAALYAVKLPQATLGSQKNLYLEFDPREGDISLEMHSSGWRQLTRDYRGAPHSTSLTVQVGPKSYPPVILFQPGLGILMVEDKSHRLHSDYFISSDSASFYLYDDAPTTRIAISPPRNRPIGFIVRSYDRTILQLQTWSPQRSQTLPNLPLLPTDRNPDNLKKVLQALLPQQISTLHLSNKQSLQLMLEQQEIAGVLTLSAEQVEVLFAKGQDAYQSRIFMTSNVANFTVTLQGHLQIMQGSTYLFFIGEIPDKAELIRYSKPIGAPHSPVYQLELIALQPVLESLSRPNPQEIQFSTPGLKYAWVPGVEHPSTLKIMGPYQGQPAQLLLEHRRSILSELTGHRPRRLVVDHYNPHATLDNQLVLQQVIPGGGESHLAYLDGRCDSLLFQSAEGYSVIHRFPAQQTLTLNGINYQVIGKQLYAIGAPNGIIDGEQLLRYHTANRRVAIRLNSSLAESTLSRDQDTLTINELTLRHLPNQTPIVLGEQAFPLRALKESVHRQRYRRALPSDKPLSSGASQNKPWTSTLIKQVVTLLGGIHWEWPTLFSSLGSRANQKPTILDSSHPTPQGLQTAGEYTVGHMQGGLQLADLVMRKITKKRYQQLGTCAPTPLTEAEARLASLQQQWASFSSHDNLAANPYRGHRVDMLSTPPNGQLAYYHEEDR